MGLAPKRQGRLCDEPQPARTSWSVAWPGYSPLSCRQRQEGTDHAMTSRTGDQIAPSEDPGDWLGSIRVAPGKSPFPGNGEGVTTHHHVHQRNRMAIRRESKTMRNKYPGVCYRCGLTVEAGKGHFEKIQSKSSPVKWRTQHADYAIIWRSKPSPTIHQARAARSVKEQQKDIHS